MREGSWGIQLASEWGMKVAGVWLLRGICTSEHGWIGKARPREQNVQNQEAREMTIVSSWVLSGVFPEGR